jgi:hypothetical protein
MKWKMSIDLSRIDWSGTGGLPTQKQVMLEILKFNHKKVKRKFGEEAFWEFDDIIVNFETCKDVEEFDDALDEMYDFGDDYGIMFTQR